MAESQNGWPVLDDDFTGPYPRLRNWHIPGCDRDLPLRDGSAGFLLVHMATWFNKNVEKIDVGFDDWGYARREIGGSNEWSNHASGTAMDLNATRHPQGESVWQSFSKTEIAGIHRRLNLYRDCLRWGGDYRGTPDGMHFEIDKGIGPVEKRARELCKSGTVGPAILKINPGARMVIFS